MIKMVNDNNVDNVRNNYPNGICPDCGTDIPYGLVSGQECANCGHVFY